MCVCVCVCVCVYTLSFDVWAEQSAAVERQLCSKDCVVEIRVLVWLRYEC